MMTRQASLRKGRGGSADLPEHEDQNILFAEWPLGVTILVTFMGLCLLVLAFAHSPGYKTKHASFRFSEAWQVPLFVCSAWMLVSGLVRLARQFHRFGLASATVIALLPLPLWAMALHVNFLAGLVVGTIAIAATAAAWGVAWNITRNALDANAEQSDVSQRKRLRVQRYAQEQDTVPLARELDLTVTEDDRLTGLRIEGRRHLLTALAAPFFLFALFSTQWAQDLVGPRTLVLLWLGSGFVGMVGVGRVANGRRMHTAVRRVCKILCVVPPMNMLVFAVFLFLSLNRQQRCEA